MSAERSGHDRDQTRPGGEIRVLTYNVRGLRRTRAYANRAAVVRIVRAARPDVVCVQEAPGGPMWRTRCSELAREAGMFMLTGGRPAAGNMLWGAARVDVHGALDMCLSRTPGRRRLPPRAVASALLGVGAVRFGVIGVHAGLSASERRRHADEIATVADRLRAAGAVGVVIGGDLNASPAAPEWSGLMARWRDAYAAAPVGAELSYPAAAPQARIDVVLAEPPIEVVSAGVFDHPDAGRASDHRPVLATLRLPPPPFA